MMDYGNASQNMFQMGLSLNEGAKVVPEILESGATAIVIDRMMRAFLGGKASRKKGITDPKYVDPKVLDHNQK